MIYFLLVALFSLLVLPSQVLGQPPAVNEELTLGGAVERALMNQPSIGASVEKAVGVTY